MTIVAQDAKIDPDLAEKVNENGWAYHFRKRAEEAEQAAEKWYDEYQKLLASKAEATDLMQGVNDLAYRAEQTEKLIRYYRKRRALDHARNKRNAKEADVMQMQLFNCVLGINDLADRCQQAEDELEQAYGQIEYFADVYECLHDLVNVIDSVVDPKELDFTVPSEEWAYLSNAKEILRSKRRQNRYTSFDRDVAEQLEGGNDDND